MKRTALIFLVLAIPASSFALPSLDTNDYLWSVIYKLWSNINETVYQFYLSTNGTRLIGTFQWNDGTNSSVRISGTNLYIDNTITISNYNHSHATNAFPRTIISGTNLLINRSYYADILFFPTGNCQIGWDTSWTTNDVGRNRIEMPSNSWTILWYPNVSITSTGIGSSTWNDWVFVAQKSSLSTNWDVWRLK